VVRTKPGADSNSEDRQLLLIAVIYSDIELGHGFAVEKCR